MSYIQILAAAVFIFASGGATGYFYALKHKSEVTTVQTRLGSGARAPWMGRDPLRYFVRFLESKIEITEDQKNQINTIIEESNLTMRKIWEDVKPKASDQMSLTNAKIKAVLTSEQADKFDALMEEFREARSKGRSGRRPSSGKDNQRLGEKGEREGFHPHHHFHRSPGGAKAERPRPLEPGGR